MKKLEEAIRREHKAEPPGPVRREERTRPLGG